MRLKFLCLFCLNLMIVSPLFAQGAGDMVERIQRLEAQMRSLNGQIETLTHQNRELENRLKKVNEDNEFRFNALEQGKAGNRPATTPSQPLPTSQPRQVQGQAPIPNALTRQYIQ